MLCAHCGQPVAVPDRRFCSEHCRRQAQSYVEGAERLRQISIRDVTRTIDYYTSNYRNALQAEKEARHE